jgi:hypothetical protein
MIGHDELFDELTQLMDALFDSSITPEEAARLEQLVEASEGARQQFLDCALVHGELCWEFGTGVDAVASEHGADFQPSPRAEPSTPRWPSPRAEPSTPRRPSPRAQPSTPRRRSAPRWPSRLLRSPWRGALLLGAAVVLGGITLYLSGIGPHELGQLVGPGHGSSSSARVGPAQSVDASGSSESSRGVRIAASAAAEWSDGGGPNPDGRVPRGGALLLRQGLAEVVFPSGARVILEGPAALESLSAQSARLSEGQLTARVPPEAVGFVIDTADARIVDRGTEFSVAVKKDKWTEVEVVSGRVDVSPSAGKAEKAWSRILATGDAVRIVSSVAGGQTQVEPIPFGTRDYAREIEPR